jgi:murein DD-endopeptidase MepM/ murein hydrolase activator NlpD
MVTELLGRGKRPFPEICINLRLNGRSSEIVLTPAAQITAVAIAFVVCGALLDSFLGHISYGRLIADKEAAVVRAETANLDLQDAVTKLRDELAAATRDRDQAEARSAALAGEADSLRARLSGGEAARPPVLDDASSPTSARVDQLTQALDQTRRELRQVEAQRAALAYRLARIEMGDRDRQERPGQIRAKLDTMTRKLRQANADRDRAIGERDRLRAMLADFEQRHSQLQILQPPSIARMARLAGLVTNEFQQSGAEPSPPNLLISDAPPDSQPEAHRMAEIGRRAVAEFQRLLGSTGLNVERLFPRLGQNRSEGGPFVPPPSREQSDAITSDQIEAMRSLVKSLPLDAPLDQYQLESRFGPRRDPFNRRVSFHTGLDLSAPYMSPVYATAPGTVIYAGYWSDYGKVVEIDHGNGIATVYGHLHRYIVSEGQKVGEHEPIGFLGSTGRSSGPHVHYEIRVNDEPQDPEKFIGLSGVIPAVNR